ncbi:MAG: aminopeptidase P family protein [bacterium]|nr:aminopeptidase P family protein [bacterium]
MEKLGAAALLVIADSSRDPDLAAFAGSAHLGKSFLLAPRGGPPVLGYLVDMERDEAAATGLDLVTPSGEEALELRRSGGSEVELLLVALASALERVGVGEGVLAWAGHPPAGETHELVRALEGRGFGSASGQALMRELRKSKSEAEIRAVRRAAEGTCAAFRRTAEILAQAEWSGDALLHGGEPLTAGRLRREIAIVLAGHGLEQPEGNIVAAGADAGVPHTQGADSRELRAGETIVIDLYPKGLLFADCTRTFCVGEPSAAVASAHEQCSRALWAASAMACPGVSGADLQNEVCRLFEDAGLATGRSHPGTRTGYVHGLGHGVGYELHELPSFRKSVGSTGTLEVGDVFTLEPGLYEPDRGFGVRLEDLLVMGADGPEKLTPLPYDLDPRAW